jgi:hypothetical protein
VPTKPYRIALSRSCGFKGISTIAAGNQLLPVFLADYNARFGKEPRNPKNLHRPWSAGDDLTDVFAWREERTVSNSLTLQYDKVLFLLEPSEMTRELRRKRVIVVDYPDGRLAIRYRGRDLPYTTSDKLRQLSQASQLSRLEHVIELPLVARTGCALLRFRSAARGSRRGRRRGVCSRRCRFPIIPVTGFPSVTRASS